MLKQSVSCRKKNRQSRMKRRRAVFTGIILPEDLRALVTSLSGQLLFVQVTDEADVVCFDMRKYSSVLNSAQGRHSIHIH